MKKEFNSMDKALDAFLYEPAVMADTQLGEQLADIDDDDIVFSDDHMNKMEKLFKKERKKINKEKNKVRFKKFSKYALRAACVLLVVIVGLCIKYPDEVKALRVRFLNFVLELGQPNTDYNFKDEGGTFYSDDEITLNYVPMGFELSESMVGKKSAYLKFSDGENYFQLEVEGIRANFSIDTENGISEKITINGNEAVYVSNVNINGAVWHNDECSFRIYGNISKDEIIKIAENVKK